MKVRKVTWVNKDGRKRERWQVNFKDAASGKRIREFLPEPGNGRPMSEKGAWEAAARLFSLQEENPTAEAVETPPAGITLTLEELLEAHRGRPGIAAHTRQMEKNQAENLMAKLGAQTPTSRISIVDLDDYVTARAEDPRRVFKRKKGPATVTQATVSGATILKEIKLLNQALRWARSRNLAAREPFVDLPTVTVETKRPRCLTREEIKALLEACGPDSAYLRQAAEVCYYSGLRRAELFRLTWANVDFEDSLLRFITVKRGRSTKRRTDIVYLPPRAIKLLRLRREALGKPGAGALVFGTLPRVWGGVESTVDQTFSDSLAAAAKRAGIARPLEIGAHTLRHSCATHLLQGNTPVPEVAAHLRHRDGGALLLRTYAHVFEDGLRRAASVLAGQFADPEESDSPKMAKNGKKSVARIRDIA